MKFLDPFVTLQYMGGASPIHITMALYALNELYSIKFDAMKEGCLEEKSYVFANDDIRAMFVSHICCVFLIFTTIILEFFNAKGLFSKNTALYMKEALKLANIVFYVTCILYI
jgi:hypothetical protein